MKEKNLETQKPENTETEIGKKQETTEAEQTETEKAEKKETEKPEFYEIEGRNGKEKWKASNVDHVDKLKNGSEIICRRMKAKHMIESQKAIKMSPDDNPSGYMIELAVVMAVNNCAIDGKRPTRDDIEELDVPSYMEVHNYFLASMGLD